MVDEVEPQANDEHEPFSDADAELLRREFEAGNYDSLKITVACCNERKQPLPTWTHELVLDAIIYAFDHGGAKGRGRGGGNAARTRQFNRSFFRYWMVKHWLDERDKCGGRTRDEVFKQASESLKGTDAYLSPDGLRSWWESKGGNRWLETTDMGR